MRPQKLHTTNEAAELVGISPRQVRHLAKRLRLGQRFGPRSLMFSDSDIEKMRERPPRGNPLLQKR